MKPVNFCWSKQVKGHIRNLTNLKERALLYTCTVYKAKQLKKSKAKDTIHGSMHAEILNKKMIILKVNTMS